MLLTLCVCVGRRGVYVCVKICFFLPNLFIVSMHTLAWKLLFFAHYDYHSLVRQGHASRHKRCSVWNSSPHSPSVWRRERPPCRTGPPSPAATAARAPSLHTWPAWLPCPGRAPPGSRSPPPPPPCPPSPGPSFRAAPATVESDYRRCLQAAHTHTHAAVGPSVSAGL